MSSSARRQDITSASQCNVQGVGMLCIPAMLPSAVWGHHGHTLNDLEAKLELLLIHQTQSLGLCSASVLEMAQ